MSIDELNEQITWLDELEDDLAKRLAVPMVYLADVYMLRFQVGRVGQRLEKRRDLLTGVASPVDDDKEDSVEDSKEDGDEHETASLFDVDNVDDDDFPILSALDDPPRQNPD